MSELESLRDRITKTREDITTIETELQPTGETRIDPAAVRNSLNFFDTVFDLLSEEEKAQILRTFIQRVTYSLEKIQIRVYDEPLDKKTKEGLGLSVPEPAGVSSGSLSRNKTLPETDNIRTWLRAQNPAISLGWELLAGYPQPE